MCRRLLLLLAAAAAVAGLAASAAPGSRALKIGIYDDGQFLGGKASTAYPMLKRLHGQVVRVTLWWGGPGGVAQRRPAKPADPADPAYAWGEYDEAARLAQASGIKLVFTIVGTPSWANGGQGMRIPPRRASDLRNFAYAAAKRYSGSFTPEGADEPLPAERYWLAWNEPNNPIFLWPQFRRAGTKLVKRGNRTVRVRRFVPTSPAAYAKICNAVVSGVHSTLIRGEKVGCGVTAPTGNNIATGSRPSISPIAFLVGMKRAGARGFDAYAHHPYYGSPSESPSAPPKSKTAVRLGNIDVLIKQLTRLYGRKRVWVTEYGYQTKPPDPFFGVSWAKQANYLSQAFSIARRNPRIDMMIWFLLRDERRLRGRDGWQSGLLTSGGKRKPAFRAFQRLPH